MLIGDYILVFDIVRFCVGKFYFKTKLVVNLCLLGEVGT